MAKRRVTVTLEEATLIVLDRQRERTGQSRSSFVDEVLARAVAGAALERVWASAQPISDGEAMGLAVSEQRANRAGRRKPVAS